MLRALVRVRTAPRDRARRRASASRQRSASTSMWSSRSTCASSARSALTADIDVPKDAAGAAGHPGHLRPRAQHDLPLARPRLRRGARGAGDLDRRQRGRLQRLSRLPPRVPRRVPARDRDRHAQRRRARRAAPRRAAGDDVEGGHHPPRHVALGVDYSLTHSCYDPDVRGLACGHCDSCILRRRGFEEAGVQGSDHVSGLATSGSASCESTDKSVCATPILPFSANADARQVDVAQTLLSVLARLGTIEKLHETARVPPPRSSRRSRSSAPPARCA